MKKALFILLLLAAAVTACRTQKKSCPQPRRNWGAEKVLDELNSPFRKK